MLSRLVSGVSAVNRAFVNNGHQSRRVLPAIERHPVGISTSKLSTQFFSTQLVTPYTEVKDLLESWGQSVVETNYDHLLNQYADESVLIPTLSNMKRESTSSRRYYFEGFSPNVTQVKWHWGKASWQEHQGMVTVSGEYDFLMVDKTVTRAQFVINVVDGKIVTHMSRSLPNMII